MRRGRFLTSVAAIAVLGLTAAACGSDDSGDDEGDSTTTAAETTETTATEGDTTTAAGTGSTPAGDVGPVGIVYDITGRGDKSFNDAAAAGLDQAKSEFGLTVEESTPSGDGDRAQRVDGLAQKGGLVVTVGFLFGDALAVSAPNYPDTSFAIIDSVVDQPNVASLTFAEEQGSFLVGAAAALKSQSGHIGFIGGVETELIQKFEAGYTAGAMAVNPDITVDVAYLTQPPDFTGFNAPDRGREVAAGMYEAGADVVYSAAGGSGLGAFEAAKAAGAPGEVWAIGVDSDQYNLVSADLQPYILTSMLKKVDVAVYETAKAYAEGNFAAGVQVFDLEAEGVGYSTTGGFVDDISAQLDEFAAQIISGEIEVPTAP
jgi:basic membrane protein A and related proteins